MERQPGGFAPFGGFLVECPNIEKACVCLSVYLSVFCTHFRGFLPSGICAGFKRRCHSVYFQRCSKGVPKKSTFKEDWSDFQGTVFFRTFSDFCAILGTRLGSLQRGRTALRVQSSLTSEMNALTSGLNLRRPTSKSIK